MQCRHRGSPQGRHLCHRGGKPRITTSEGEFLLPEAPSDVPLKVKSIHGGEKMTARLATLRLIPGETVKLIQNNHWGPLLVEVKGAKVALGRGMANCIIVTQ